MEAKFLSGNEQLWHRLPVELRASRPVTSYGHWLHTRVRRHSDREMYLGTQFLRNRPALELMRRRVHQRQQPEPVKIAVLGCSIGAEAYSIAWTLRSARPDLRLVINALDVASEVLQVAEAGVYSPAASAMVHASIFQGLTDVERSQMFDWDGTEGTIKPWLREGVSWELGDASDAGLVARLGPHDVVVASNFLCHMPAHDADPCLRNLARLVRPGGYLFVTGVDVEVRTKVARELGWKPVSELRSEIHDGDSMVRSDWPWRWWGLEPLDRRRPDWETRYSAVFQIGDEHGR